MSHLLASRLTAQRDDRCHTAAALVSVALLLILHNYIVPPLTMGAFGLLKEFSGWTSAHGIPQIGGARNWPVRVIWFVIFLGALGMFLYQMSIIVDTFLTYGVIVSTTLNYGQKHFPAVTICNSNAYKASQVVADTAAQQMLQDYTQSVINGAVSSGDTYKFNNETDDDLVKSSHAQFTMALIAKAWSDADHKAYTYTAMDMILHCEYGHESCSYTDFEAIDDPVYGRCYQFNNDGKSERMIYEPGPEFGLRVLLYSAQKEFLPTMDTSTFKVSVHPPQHEPFTDAFGYDMAMGYVNQVAIKQPYGSCTESKSGQMFFYDTEEYTMEGCFRSCYQTFIVGECSCADPRFAKLDGDTWCTTNDLACLLKVRQDQLDNVEGAFKQQTMCTCPQRCVDTTYSALIHQQWWPNDMYSPSSCALWRDHFAWNDTTFEVTEANATWDDCKKMWHENSLMVEVYFDTLISTDLDESAAYTVHSSPIFSLNRAQISDTIFNFGGQIGLWMGFSAITMVEWVGLAMLIGLACCAKLRGPAPISDNDIHKKDMDDIDAIIDKAYDTDGEGEGEEEGSSSGSDESSIDPYEEVGEEEQEPPTIV